MILRGIKFRYAFDQSGVRNFDGHGWPYHKALKYCPGFSFHNCSFVAKTTTLHPRRGPTYGEAGNMPLEEDGITPRELLPRCVYVRPGIWWQGVALNAVGLSGPGLLAILESGIWQAQKEPFQISVMAVGETMADRLRELREMVRIFQTFVWRCAPFAIQLNISCPNVGHEDQIIEEKIREVRASLFILRDLRAPCVIKINTNFLIEAALEISKDPNCDGFCNSNTIPWNEISKQDRMRMFGTIVSPLADLGGGGISGAYLFPRVVRWVKNARIAGITKPIIAGGGILKPDDVNALADVGASAIAVGSVAFLRPWRVQKIIDRANDIGAKKAYFA